MPWPGGSSTVRVRWVGLAVWALAMPLAGHERAGAIWSAGEIPDHALPVIDGDLREWALLGFEGVLTEDDFVDLVHGRAPSPADLGIRLQIGWSRSTNSLYLGASVYDDVHQVDRPFGAASTRIFQDDALEVFVDADHSGGQYADFAGLEPDEALRITGTQANHFVLAGPHPDGVHFVNYSAAAWYALPDGPYTEAVVRYDAAARVTRYELRLVPFDRIDVYAAFQSDEHQLQAGQVLGFNVEVDDFDVWSELYDAKWSLSGAQGSYRSADRFGDLILLPFEGIFPASIESLSWGRVKAAVPR